MSEAVERDATAHQDETGHWAMRRAVLFAVGFVSPLFDPQDMAAGRFDRIERRARTLLAAVSCQLASDR